MNRFIYLLVLLFVYNFCSAEGSSKLGLYLSEKLKQTEFAHSSQLQPLLVKGNAEAIQSLTEQYQGIFKFHAKDICSIEIPYKNLKAFAKEEAVERIENSFAPGVMLMDTARINNNIDKVHTGSAPLSQAYTGKGVVVGIIDGGIFFQHGDFRNANGTTRIRNLWDQNGVGTAPPAYGYGAEWDSTTINNGGCTHIPPSSNQGHGTNVAGIATGNGLGATTAPLKAQYKGVAPECNIVVVRIDNTSNDFLQKMADAADYIYKKADALGMPCVINTSVGTYYGSHDGKDLAAEAIDNMLCAKKGRVFVAAAGNSADKRIHLGYTLSATDSLFTWFKYNATTASVYYDLWADTNQFKAANFAIGCDNSTPAFLKRTKYYNILTDFNPPQGGTVQIDDSLFNGATKLGNYSIYATLEGGTYHIEFLIYPVVTTYLWRLQTKGTGAFDLWANKSLIGTSDMQLSPLPGGFTSPNYRFSDSLKTMVSSWVCSDKVITVGNYSNGHIYKDVDGINRDPLLATGETRQDLFPTSSWGPTRDGRQKPNITATGSTTIATGDSFNIALLMGAPSNKLKIGIGGKHNRNGGTSMASPIVTGIAALYLEKRPTAGYDEVMKAIQLTAKTDAFTGAVPNPKWGYGKVDAFRVLTVPIYGCKDPASSNYNASATIDTGGCAYNYVWNGSQSANWNDPKNWTPNLSCCGPNSCDANVTIPAGKPYDPSIIYGDVQTGNVNVANNVTITILNNRKWNVCKNWTGAGTASFVSGGKVVMNGTTSQSFSGTSRIDSLELDNSAGYTLSGTTEVYNRLTLKKGTLNTAGGTLKFLSTSDTHCATIDFSGSNTGTISGNITAQRWVPVSGKNQHFISSPVNNVPLSQLGASGTAGYVLPTVDCDETQLLATSPYGTVFQFHEDSGAVCALKSWESLTSGNATNARGYSVYLNGNQSIAVTAAPNMAASYTLSGLTNSAWATNVSKQGRPMSAGWNLAGNPYLSVLNLNTHSGFDAQVGVWQTSGTYTGTYQTLMMGSNAIIPPFQGFMVHRTSGSGSLVIDKTECVNYPASVATFYKTANDYEMNVKVEGNGFADITKIAFNTSATNNFDPMLDANKLHSRLGQPTIYSLNNAIHMSHNILQDVASNPTVPLSLEPGANGVFTFNFEGINSFDKYQVFLEDKKTADTWVDVKAQPIYVFTANASDNWDRFVLHFSQSVSGINKLDKENERLEIIPNPFGKETMFSLYNFEKERMPSSIKIYDQLGRLVDEIEIENNTTSIQYLNAKLKAGVYFAILQKNGKTILSRKIVVE